jgi:hypothetical protein
MTVLATRGSDHAPFRFWPPRGSGTESTRFGSSPENARCEAVKAQKRRDRPASNQVVSRPALAAACMRGFHAWQGRRLARSHNEASQAELGSWVGATDLAGSGGAAWIAEIGARMKANADKANRRRLSLMSLLWGLDAQSTICLIVRSYETCI